MKRKDTILTQITSLSKLRYADDEEKQKELIKQAEAALEEERAAYLSARHTIKRRETVDQQADYKYKVFRESTKGNEEVQFYSGDKPVEVKEPELEIELDAEEL
uniref:Uncharacterized protein n=1 Tax=Strombidium inclinatum TaxID=197538 RepID=A0A7S3IF97_9SPIT|mmetsp:Transcript_15725/g.24157  ORF Transcript_15725/g.24157 Transcript_15725/m.24157 type:complete len:104 (+) Transcript_15725:2452-2763(+)